MNSRLALVPPKPKELDMTAVGHSSLLMSSATSASASTGGSGCLRFTVGGTVLSTRLFTEKMASTAPARWLGCMGRDV